jgi:GTPase involved in cell partitioning and DNA repair
MVPCHYLSTHFPHLQQVHYRSKDGQNGQGKSRHGPRAENLVVQVPPGTVVRDLQGRFAGELVRLLRMMVVMVLAMLQWECGT